MTRGDHRQAGPPRPRHPARATPPQAGTTPGQRRRYEFGSLFCQDLVGLRSTEDTSQVPRDHYKGADFAEMSDVLNGWLNSSELTKPCLDWSVEELQQLQVETKLTPLILGLTHADLLCTNVQGLLLLARESQFDTIYSATRDNRRLRAEVSPTSLSPHCMYGAGAGRPGRELGGAEQSGGEAPGPPPGPGEAGRPLSRGSHVVSSSALAGTAWEMTVTNVQVCSPPDRGHQAVAALGQDPAPSPLTRPARHLLQQRPGPGRPPHLRGLQGAGHLRLVSQ